MQNVWLHFKACLNFAHTLVARIVSSFLPVFLLFSFLSCKGIFSPFGVHLLSHLSTCQSARFEGDLIGSRDLSEEINTHSRLITPSDKLKVEAFLSRTTSKAGWFLSDCSVWSWRRERLPPPEIADMSDVSSTLRVRMPWAARVAEARTWPKRANPLHVSPRPVSGELQGFPLKP